MDVEQQIVETTVEEVVSDQVIPGETPPAEPPLTPASEETPVIDTEAQLAADALAATEEGQPVAPEGVATVPVSVVAELRAERRENRQAIEMLNAKLVELTKPPEPVVESSPLEKWVAENPEDAEVTGPPGTVQLAEKKWQARQTEQQAQVQVTNTRISNGAESQARAKATLTDYDEVTELGIQYLSPGDRLDITVSKDPAMELYKRCQRATLQSGTPDAAVMRLHLQTKLTKTKQSGPKPQVTPTVTHGTRTPLAPSAVKETSERPMNPRLAHIQAIFGIE